CRCIALLQEAHRYGDIALRAPVALVHLLHIGKRFFLFPLLRKSTRQGSYDIVIAEFIAFRFFHRPFLHPTLKSLFLLLRTFQIIEACYISIARGYPFWEFANSFFAYGIGTVVMPKLVDEIARKD